MRDKQELVSIIVPVYNTKEYLCECLDSIIEQDYKNLEIIIVDDGSTDGSEVICDQYSHKDDRINVIHTANGGLVSARKIGLHMAKGAYVGFVDSDDFVAPNMYSSLVEAIEEMGVDFVHSGYIEISGTYETTIMNFDKEVFIFQNKEDYVNFIRKHTLDIIGGEVISYSIWSKLFKRELVVECYEKVENHQQFGEDAICLFNCIFHSSKIGFLPIALYKYRNLETSMSHVSSQDHFVKQVKFCSEMVELLNEYGYLDFLRDEVFVFCESSLLPIIKKNPSRSYLLTQYYLENIESIRDKKIVIYGAGAVGQDVYFQLSQEQVNVIGIVDKHAKKLSGFNLKVLSPFEINELVYDAVLVAVLNKEMADEIMAELQNYGVHTNKIVWEKPKRYF